MSFALTLPVWLLVVLAVFACAWLIQLCIQLTVHRAPLRHAKKEAASRIRFAEEQPGVSVVVYAHNQAEELLRNLPHILDSDYPCFEVIVVDDGSTDYTSDVLTQMQQRYMHFSHTTLGHNVRNVSRSKMAMMLGMKAAQYDIILMTQAQCLPVSSHWISHMVRQFNSWTDVVLGPVAYETRTGIMNRFYQWDLFQRMIYMMGLTLTTSPYSGWSTNMAFRKRIFF
ncbi:MAG: glycosyltransferase, partial [Bacteroidales bacterium]|nr:glycosyltransferase [Bacteroidales bacterium]